MDVPHLRFATVQSLTLHTCVHLQCHQVATPDDAALTHASLLVYWALYVGSERYHSSARVQESTHLERDIVG